MNGVILNFDCHSDMIITSRVDQDDLFCLTVWRLNEVSAITKESHVRLPASYDVWNIKMDEQFVVLLILEDSEEQSTDYILSLRSPTSRK